MHQTARDGNSAGHKASIDKQANRKALNPATGISVNGREWDHGKTTYARFYTQYTQEGDIGFGERS